MFSSDTYKARRKALKAKIGSGLILFPGNHYSPKNYKDNIYHFRQDSNFLYYFGLDQAHLAAIIDADSGEETLFGDDLSMDDIVWTGPQPSMDDRAYRCGAREVKPYKEIRTIINAAISVNRTVHFVPPYRAEREIALAKWLGIPQTEVKNRISQPLIEAIVEQRSIKTEEEIREIEKAVNITRAMHVKAMQTARPGIKESHIAGVVNGIAIAGGAGTSFPPIITVNGQTLHNHSYTNTLVSGQLLLGDFGAESATHYAGDVTRTYPVDAKFTDKQKEIYQIVLDSQMAAIKACKPGKTYRDIHLLAAKTIINGLSALGILKGDADELAEEGVHALFFPHGLGHMMGLDVHDMEDLGEDNVGYDSKIIRSTQFGLRSLRLGKKLETGNVITVEPGIYFIPQLIDRWKEDDMFPEFINYELLETYKDFGGIRIEDDLLITENGSRVLGKPIPKTIEEIEAIREKALA